MTTNDPWLKPQQETPEQKAERKRRAEESPASVRQAIRQLEAMQSQRQASSPPQPSTQPEAPARPHPQQRYDPRVVVTGPEPQPIAERPVPRTLDEPEAETPPEPDSAARPAPDPRLVEIAQTWSWLSERDREELLLLVRVKAHLNQKAAGK